MYYAKAILFHCLFFFSLLRPSPIIFKNCRTKNKKNLIFFPPYFLVGVPFKFFFCVLFLCVELLIFFLFFFLVRLLQSQGICNKSETTNRGCEQRKKYAVFFFSSLEHHPPPPPNPITFKTKQKQQKKLTNDEAFHCRCVEDRDRAVACPEHP